jgi:hypothetical protein
MIFFFGLRLFGRVDEVPGRFYVATEFYHVQFLPVVPMQTYLVLRQDADGWEGVKIPLCRKSLAVAWLRAAALVLAGVAALWALAEAARSDSRWQTPAAVALVATAVFVASKWWRVVTHAHVERACELARLAGYRDRAIAEIRGEYGHGGEAEPPASAEADAASPSAQPRMYFVSGRDRSSGQDVCVTVWAADEANARAASVARGIDISQVECATR